MQGGSWIAAIAMTFLMSPPGHTAYPHVGPVSWTALSRFVVAAANVAAAIGAAQYARPRFLKRWIVIATCSFFIGILSLATYASLFGQWTCLNEVGTTVVVGNQINPKRVHQDLSAYHTDRELLNAVGNDPLQVWAREDIVFRENILGLLFMVTILCMSLGVIALLQAHKLATIPERAEPVASDGTKTGER